MTSPLSEGMGDEPKPEGFESTLVAYARRKLDAVAAATLVCDGVARRGGPVTRCGLVAAEPRPGEVVAGSIDNDERPVLVQAFARAASSRLLASRNGEQADLFNAAAANVTWIAVEPLTTRGGTFLGSLVAIGAEGERDDVLTALPSAGLFCEVIAYELLERALVARKVHQFNNVLASVAANVEHFSLLVGTPNADRDELTTCVKYASDGIRALIKAAAALRR